VVSVSASVNLPLHHKVQKSYSKHLPLEEVIFASDSVCFMMVTVSFAFSVWILMKQEMMGWQWHQLDHKQIICTSLQTDNHASTLSLIFLQAGCSF